MFGESCVAFNLESLTEMLTFGTLVQRASQDDDLGDDLSKLARYDSMGRGVVLYFPSVSWDDYVSNLDDIESGIDGEEPEDGEDVEDGEED
jgi:hypothetical protein